MKYVLKTIDISVLTLGKFLALMGCAVGLAAVLALVYAFTHRKSGVRSSVTLTMLLLGPVASLVVLLVGNSLAKAVTVGGGIALIRYRSTLDDPLDLAYLFLSLALGMACGVGAVGVALISGGIFALLLVILSLCGVDRLGSKRMKLKILIPEHMDFQGAFDDLLGEFCSSWRLERVKTADFGTLQELTFRLTLKDTGRQKAFLDEIRTRNGNLTVTLTQANTDN